MRNNDNLGEAFRRKLLDYQSPNDPNAWTSFVKSRPVPFWKRGWFSGGIVGIYLIGMLIWQRQNKVNDLDKPIALPASPRPTKPLTWSVEERPASHPQSAQVPTVTSQVQSLSAIQSTNKSGNSSTLAIRMAQKTSSTLPNGLVRDTLIHTHASVTHAAKSQPLNQTRSVKTSLSELVFPANRLHKSVDQRLRRDNVNHSDNDRIGVTRQKESPTKIYALPSSTAVPITVSGGSEAATPSTGQVKRTGSQPALSRFTQSVLPLTLSLTHPASKTLVGRELISLPVAQSAVRRPSSAGIRLGLTLQPSLLQSRKTARALGGGLSIGIPLTRRLDLTTGVLIIRQQATLSHIVTDSVRRDSSQTPVLTSRFIDTDCAWWGLEIPLNLRYSWHQRPRQSWLTTVGLSSLITLGSIQSTSGEPVSYTNRFQPFRLLMVSVGIDRTLTKQYHLVVSPFAKIPLGSVGINELRFSTIGIQLNLLGYFTY